MEELSEEELLEYELAEEDLDIGEAEEEEWRRYDEEVQQFRDLVLASGAGAPFGDGELGPAAEGPWARASDAEPTVAALKTAAAAAEATGAPTPEPVPGPGDAAGGGATADEVNSVLAALLARSAAAAPKPPPAAAAAWAPGAEAPAGHGFTLPVEYRTRLTEGEGGIVVSQSLGPNTVVLLSRVPDQPELLPVLSETFRARRVRILRGWLEATDSTVMDAFEVCDARTGGALSEEDARGLEEALVQAMRAPAARHVLLELDDQLPRLGAFFGLPAGGLRPPSLPAARGALVGSPFRVYEARDLGRALAFRGELELAGEEALNECRRCLAQVCEPEHEEEWDCFLVDGLSGQWLVLLPTKDLEEALAPPFEQRLLFFLCLGATMLYAQAAAPAAALAAPVGALLFGIIGVTELARAAAAQRRGVSLGLPLLLPSPAIGTFGACTRVLSAVPNAAALFDIVWSGLAGGMAASLTLILLGLLTPATERSCAWVNPNVFPHFLHSWVMASAEQRWGVCSAPAAAGGPGFVPVDPALVAGCFGALAASLNALPLGRLDGMAILGALPWASVRDTVLPYSALLLLGSATFSSEADGLFPLVLFFSFFTFLVRPQLEVGPVLRDNVTKPRDTPRQVASALMFLTAFLLLMPTPILNTWWALWQFLGLASA